MRLSQNLRPFLTFALGATCAANCSADWQFTIWGMSVEQVIDASHGALRKVGGAGPIKVKGPYSTGDATYDAVFYFSDSGLDGVGLAQDGAGNCQATKAALVAKYGAPSDSTTQHSTWRSAETGDLVEWTDLIFFKRKSGASGGDCLVSYKPLSSAGEGM
jgi:hypothetical protein